MSASGVLQAVRPYLWLALVAFLVGFLSYLALGGAHAQAGARAPFAPKASAPAGGDWNLPKRI